MQLRMQLRILASLLLAPIFARTVVAQAPRAPAPAPAPAPAARATSRALSGLDQFVTAQMTEWHVPGLALGIIQDGRVVLLKGYGFRDVEQKLPVTPRTLMAIGSNSKSFTVVLMGMLADSGKLDWDKPVRDYLPDFQLHDELASEAMTPRDLVTHRSGLPRHDLFWYGGSLGREEMYRRLKYLEPNTSFRGRWQYQNLMFMTAGYLVEKRTGRSWDDLIRERIFGPLGMSRSNTSVRDLPASDDAALAYVSRHRGRERRCAVAGGKRRSGRGRVWIGEGAVPEHRCRRAGRLHQLERRRDAPLHTVSYRLGALRGARDPVQSQRHADANAPNAGRPPADLAGRLRLRDVRTRARRDAVPRAQAGAARRRHRRIHFADVLAAQGADWRGSSHEHVGQQSGAESRDGKCARSLARPGALRLGRARPAAKARGGSRP